MMNRISSRTVLRVICTSIISFVWVIPAMSAADRIVLNESYADKVECSGDKVDGWMCETYPIGKFSFRATASFSPSNTVDVSTLSTNTAVAIVVGGWELDTAADNSGFSTLGDATALKFKSSPNEGIDGVTATYLLLDDVAYDRDCDLAEKPEGKVTLTVNETGLTASVSASTGEDNLSCADNLENSPDAANFDGDPSGLTNDTITVSISLGDTFSVSTNLIVNVKVSTVTTKDGDTQASKISVTGAGSF